jgi:hypothetical protein
LGKNWPIQGLDQEGKVCVPLHMEPPRDHGTILEELSKKVFDRGSGYTIRLPIPHDKSNAWSKEYLGSSAHPSVVDRIPEELIQ